MKFSDLTVKHFELWESLWNDSLEQTPFLSPEFYSAECQFLNQKSDGSLLIVVDQTGEFQLLAPVVPIEASTRMPFPHYELESGPYTFQSGFLVRKSSVRTSLQVMMQSLRSSRFRHGLFLSQMPIETELTDQLLTAAVLNGFSAQIPNSWERACLRLDELDAKTSIIDFASKTRRKSLRRARKDLEDRGSVEFRLLDQQEELEGAISHFLQLENAGWKNTTGTAIDCQEGDRNFFTDFLTRYSARGQVIFAELLLNQKVVASSCNLIAGETLYAFKIGWDESLKSCSPGIWAELELAEAIRRTRPEIRMINSCATKGSYLEKIWPHRMLMGGVILSHSNRAFVYRTLKQSIREAKTYLWPFKR